MVYRIMRAGTWLAVVLVLLALVLPTNAAYAAGAPADTAGSIATTTALWGIVVGVITPPLVAIVQQPHWSTQLRTVVGVAIAVGFAAITCWVDGTIGHGQTLIATIGTVLVGAQATYRELWSKVGVTQKIEGATATPKGRTVPRRR